MRHVGASEYPLYRIDWYHRRRVLHHLWIMKRSQWVGYVPELGNRITFIYHKGRSKPEEIIIKKGDGEERQTEEI